MASRLLVVEDDDQIPTALRRALDGEGDAVGESVSPEEPAGRWLRRHPTSVRPAAAPCWILSRQASRERLRQHGFLGAGRILDVPVRRLPR